MLKMKRDQVDELAGRRKAPAVVAPAAPAPDPSNDMREAIVAMSLQVAKLAEAARVATERKSRKLEAIVHRGSDGKMARVEINVV